MMQNVTLNDHRSIHSHNVSCELQRRGFKVDLILQKTDQELQFRNIPYNLIQISGETYSMKGQLQFMKASYTTIREGSYDIIHAKNPFSSVLSPILLRKMHQIKSKIIYDMRGLWVDFGIHAGEFSPFTGKMLNALDTELMQLCDHVIAISPELKHVLVTRGIPLERITTIKGSGVNIEEIEKAVPEPLDQKISGILIGYIGTVSASRQSDKLIEAFQYVRKHCRDCHLVLIGPEDGTINNLFSVKNVHYLGMVPHERAISFLKSFHVAVSYHDRDEPIFNVAVPIKILEYMAAGIPIVATTHAMYTNILDHKRTGYLTAPDPESFAQGILTVLDDTQLREFMARRAALEVEKYSIRSLCDQLESCYQKF